MKTKLVSISLIFALFVTTGCGLIGSLVGGGSSATSALWADVPAMEGMTRVQADLPLPIKLAVQALVRASGASEGIRVDNLEFVAYTSSKTPDDLKAFYTLERMQAAGWNLADQPGCAGLTDQGQVAGGTFCMFGKQGTGSSSLLVIFAGRDENKSTMDVFFMRFDGDISVTPSGN